MHRIFEQYDSDGSGAISAHELQLLCADLGVHLSKREVREALKKLDKDGSASLSFDEFFPWWQQASYTPLGLHPLRPARLPRSASRGGGRPPTPP